jgi:hypothetical protein
MPKEAAIAHKEEVCLSKQTGLQQKILEYSWMTIES